MSIEPEMKQALLDYNRQDCEAIALLTKTLLDLRPSTPSGSKPSQQNLVITSDMKRENLYGFRRNQFALPDLEIINKAAYWDYQRERVYVKSRRESPRKRKHIAVIRGKLTPNATIEHTQRSSCPKCQSEQMYRIRNQSRNVVDLRFTDYGIKRWVIRHSTQRYCCRLCKRTFNALDGSRPTSKYGSNIIAYVVYLNIELRLSLSLVTYNIRKLFSYLSLD